jgi:LPXTG-motif cell wall-anchored protein
VLYNSFGNRARKMAAAGAIGVMLTIGSAGVAAAGDDHSGGVSPTTGGVDPGTEVKGNVVARDPGGLPVTGSDVIGLVVVGAAAVGVGSTAVVASRRRASRATA